ncbi:Enhancer of polycomb-like protein 1 [Taxawa tesnikishii (nom. ined.)]|nr:Enhancer of polycomb-like protein 1 [Dothideales sp. JES 119]
MSRATGARFRQRKLSTKQSLRVVREDEVPDLITADDDAGRVIPRLETGVEKAEETEHHLQAVISASAAAAVGGKVAQIYIPTPETKSSSIKYEELYPKRFKEPATYIRFSSTVEDCIGPPYDMDEEDDAFLATLNEGKSQTNGKCSEDLFEEVMSFFEETSAARQPFAAVDNPPVVTFEEMESSYDDTISAEGRKWAKDIYEHWHARRVKHANRSLMPNLKFETGQETDDSDPYVCFRRREVRQARKTRGRDAQVVEKLKKMRIELEQARQLVHLVNQRELKHKERLEIERKIFEQRGELKRVKTEQGIKGDKGDDEELLVNQRPVPKIKTKAEGAQQRPTTLRLSTSRPEGRQAENDLTYLSDIQEETAASVQRSIEEKIAQHRKWNKGFVDDTWGPITPPLETAAMSGFLPVLQEHQLPTPPASVRSVSTGEAEQKADVEMKDVDLPTPVSSTQDHAPPRTMFRFQSPPPDPTFARPAFRRRYGRGGRLHIEECRPKLGPVVQTSGVVYDSDESDGDEVVFPVDYYDNNNMGYRAALLQPRSRLDPAAEQAARRATASGGGDVAMANGQSTAGHLQQQPSVTPAGSK